MMAKCNHPLMAKCNHPKLHTFHQQIYPSCSAPSSPKWPANKIKLSGTRQGDASLDHFTQERAAHKTTIITAQILYKEGSVNGADKIRRPLCNFSDNRQASPKGYPTFGSTSFRKLARGLSAPWNPESGTS